MDSASNMTVPTSLGLLITTLVLLFLNPGGLLYRKHTIPVINGRNSWEWSSARTVNTFLMRAEDLLKEGLQKSKAFILMTNAGPRMILSSDYVNEVKGLKDLSFRKFIHEHLLSSTPGLEPFEQGVSMDGLQMEVIKTKLTHQLLVVTKPLSEETNLTMDELWGISTEWHEIQTLGTMSHLIARLSARVFMGEKLCRDLTVLSISLNYTVDSMAAVSKLKEWSKFSRPVVHWFIPKCQKTRTYIQQFRDILEPEIESRRKVKAECLRMGKPVPEHNDVIDWLDQIAKGRSYDAVICQLALSTAAIHTTSDLITETLFRLCENPDIIQPLREEMIAVMKEDGWKKTALQKLRLLDSVLKETQRLKPPQMVSMQRKALKTIKLEDGLQIPKGTLVEISSDRMWNPKVYKDPLKWDGERFLKLRELPGQGNLSQLVTTSADHFAFGHGIHACPGRFFASNETKIAMIHLLLKYDIAFPKGVATSPPFKMGVVMLPSPVQTIMVRRRKEEVDLDTV